MATDLSQFVTRAPEQGFAAGGTGRLGTTQPGERDLSAFVTRAPEQGVPHDIDLSPFVATTDFGLGDELVSGVSSGTDQLQTSLFGLTRMIGRELGIDTLEDIGAEGIDRNQAEAQSTPMSVQGFTDVESFDDFTRWAAGTLGNALPSLALAMGGGGIGGLLAKKAVETSIRQTIMNRMKKNLLSKGLTDDVADKAIREAITSPAGMTMLKNGMSRGIDNATLIHRGFTRGAHIGVTGSAGVPIAGDTDISLVERGIESGFTSIVAGLAGGALEILPVARLIDRAFPGIETQVAKSFIKDFAVSTGLTQGLLEGSTEAAQEVVQLAALAFHDPTFDMLNATNGKQILNAFAAGALVGAVTGGVAEVVGGGTRRARKLGDVGAPAALPRFSLDPDKGPAPESIKDFVPADNTFYEEVKSRVNSVVTATIEPAVNTIRDQYQAGVDAVAGAVPALNRTMSKLTKRGQAAQEEFLAGHKPIIDDVTRYAKEQAAFITDEAQHLFGDERKAFVEEKLAEVKQQVDEVAAALKERTNKIIESLTTDVAGMGVLDEFNDLGRIETDTEFTFGKSNTEGDTAQGFKNRSGARALIDKLRKRFPSASDSTFGIREQEDGTFTVALEDSGQAEDLREDEVVAKAITASRHSARGNPDRAGRQAKVQMKGVSGQTFLDVRTLVFEGRKLGQGSNQTVEQAFAAMMGRMLDQGIIGDDGFLALQEAFDKIFPGKLAKEKLTETLVRDNRIVQLKERLKDIPQATLDTEAGQRAITKDREELFRLEKDSTRGLDEFKTAVSREDFTEEVKIEGEPSAQDVEDQLDSQAADTRRRGRPTPARPVLALQKNIDRLKKAIAGLPVPSKRTAAEEAEFKSLRQSLLILERNATPARAPGTQAPTAQDNKTDTAGESTGPTKGKTPKGKTPKGVPNRGLLKGFPSIDKKIAAYLPKMNAKIVKALDVLLPKISNLLSDKIKVRIINAQAAAEMRIAGHPDSDMVAGMTPGRFEITWAVHDKSARTLYIMVDDFKNPGRSLSGMLHEIGHAINFDTWADLTAENQDRLWNAFKADVKSGFRGTGADINMDGINRPSPDAALNVFEFREWMADKFVDWMNNRKQPTTAMEKFLESVGSKIDQMWAFMTANKRRFSFTNVDETYAQFMDAVAKKIRERDPSGTNPFFINENAGGRNLFSLSKDINAPLPGIPRGLTRPQWTEIQKRLTDQYPVIAARTKLITDWIHNAYHLAAAPSTSVMRSIAERVPAAKQLVSIFNREEHGKAKKSANYHQRLKLMKGRFIEARYTAITKNMTEAEKISLLNELRTADGDPSFGSQDEFESAFPLSSLTAENLASTRKNLEELMKKPRNKQGVRTEADNDSINQAEAFIADATAYLNRAKRKPLSRKAKEVRKLFDEVHAYMKEAGLPVGKIVNYFPRTYSREKLIANEAQIVRHLTSRFRKELSEQQIAEDALDGANRPRIMAQKFFNSMISREADEAAALRELQLDELSMQSPSFRNMNSRTAGDPFLSKYLDDNLDGIVTNYLNAAIKKGEFNRFLGAKAPRGVVGGQALAKKVWNSRGKVEAILRNAENQGATKQDLKMMKDYVDANLGMYGRDSISDRTRAVLAGVIAYTNLRTLLFTVFASLPDTVGPAIRSGNMRATFKTAFKNIDEIRLSDSELSERARAWGIISSVANQHMMTEYVDNHFMPPTLRKWNEAFFRWTGLNYYTDFTRKYALAVGVDTIKNEAIKVNNQALTQKKRDRAKQFLAELGLTSDMVDAWVDGGERTWGGIGYETESANDEKIAEALIQFVDESIMSPNPSQRPLLASHPAFVLVYHLKGFIYAMHDVVLKRLAHNFEIADTPAQVAAAISPAILMLALTAFGLELRELITGDNRTGRMDGWEYTWETMERSGLLGITQLGWDFESAGARGQSEFVALGGPAIGQLADLISKPISQTIPKAIPIVSQLPWARDALREATPL